MEEFEDLVGRAVEEIPQEFQPYLAELDVIVEDCPPRALLREMGLEGRGTLLGLYQGVPLSRRSVFQNPSLPDRIVVYRLPTLRMCRSRRQVVDQVRKTVVHEIAHHFGMSDEYLRGIGC